jgi:putative methyltransferase (TIGR04325 family)
MAGEHFKKAKALLRRAAEHVLPPVLYRALDNLLFNQMFRGDYGSFQEALAAFDAEGLLRNRKYVELAFQAGPPMEDRPYCDAVELGVLAGFALPLLRRTESGRFRVLDFGGGPGGRYYFMRDRIPASIALHWDVFDTEPMAERGRKERGTEQLRFFSEWKDVADNSYDVILAGNALHCFERPYEEIMKLAVMDCRYLLLHDVPVIPGGRDRIVVQTPPPVKLHRVYRKGNYPYFPVWFFSEEGFLQCLSLHYAIKTWWFTGTEALLEGQSIPRRSYLLEKRQPMRSA